MVDAGNRLGLELGLYWGHGATRTVNEMVDPAFDPQSAVCIEMSNVTGSVPAANECMMLLEPEVVIPGARMSGSDPDLTQLVGINRCRHGAGWSADATDDNVDAWQRLANANTSGTGVGSVSSNFARPNFPRPNFAGRGHGDRHNFGHAIGRKDMGRGKHRLRSNEKLWRHRSSGSRNRADLLERTAANGVELRRGCGDSGDH
jgi:hypothetical protein